MESSVSVSHSTLSMAASLPTYSPLPVRSRCYLHRFRSPSHYFPLIPCSSKSLLRFHAINGFHGGRIVTPSSPAFRTSSDSEKSLKLPETLLPLVVSAVLFCFGFCFSVRACSASSPTLIPCSSSVQQERTMHGIKRLKRFYSSIFSYAVVILAEFCDY